VLVAVFILFTTTSVYAAGEDQIYDHVWIRVNGVNYWVLVWKFKPNAPEDPAKPTPDDFDLLGTKYADGDCGNSAHKTSEGNFFEHAHIHDAHSFPLEGRIMQKQIGSDPPETYNPAAGEPANANVTEERVNAYWDWWYGVEAQNRGNDVRFGGYYSPDPTYNCYGHSFERSDIWIVEPSPIYEDDYVPVSGSPPTPKVGDVINISGHVITISSINYSEIPPPVIGTSEKNQHSRIYYFLYEDSEGLTTYKDYHRRK
jgi:hypothetical protein